MRTLGANHTAGTSYGHYFDFTGDSTWNFGKLSAGTYTVTMTVDSENAVVESNENNNVYARTFTVNATDTADAGDTIATAASWSLSNGSGRVYGKLGSGVYGAKDVDVYKVRLSAGKTYEFRTAEQSGRTTVDTYLRVADSTGETLAANDDGGSGNYSLLTFTPLTSGYYYVAVSQYANRSVDLTTTSGRSDASTGFYVLTATPIVVAPTNLRFGDYNASTRTATLSWADNATNEAYYEIQSSTNGGAWTSLTDLAANTTSRVCSRLLPGKTFIYRIRAASASATSEWATIVFHAPSSTSSATLASEAFANPFDDFDFFEEEWNFGF